MGLVYLFFFVLFGAGALVAGSYWTLIRSSYMERHGLRPMAYFFWKPEELVAMLKAEKAYVRMMCAGLGVAASSMGVILLLSWLFD